MTRSPSLGECNSHTQPWVLRHFYRPVYFRLRFPQKRVSFSLHEHASVRKKWLPYFVFPFNHPVKWRRELKITSVLVIGHWGSSVALKSLYIQIIDWPLKTPWQEYEVVARYYRSQIYLEKGCRLEFGSSGFNTSSDLMLPRPINWSFFFVYI